MKETYALELNFANAEGSTRKITLKHPKEGLTDVEILPAMQAIVDAGIFSVEGVNQYETVKNARYVRTTVEEVLNTEE